MPFVFGGLWIALPKTPFKSFGAQEISGMGWPFLWILSFGDAKESIAVAGPRTGIQSSFALANYKTTAFQLKHAPLTRPMRFTSFSTSYDSVADYF